MTCAKLNVLLERGGESESTLGVVLVRAVKRGGGGRCGTGNMPMITMAGPVESVRVDGTCRRKDSVEGREGLTTGLRRRWACSSPLYCSTRDPLHSSAWCLLVR